jgi:cell division transport system permease protein
MWINIATTGVLALSFGFILGMGLLSQNISRLFTVWGEDIQLSVYLKDGLSDSEKTSIEGKIKSSEAVSKYNYVNKKQASEIFEKSLKNYGSQFLGALKTEIENPFPASFQIQIKPEFRKPELINDVATSLQAMAGVEEVSFGQEWVKNYTVLAKYGRVVGLVGGFAILVSCLLVISNSIRASLQSRKEEIEILELVGATIKTIRTPFIVEGAIQGFLGCTLAMFLLFVLYRYFFSFLEGMVGAGTVLDVLGFFPLSQIVLFLFVSAVIGAAGSYFCVAQINSGWAAAGDGK